MINAVARADEVIERAARRMSLMGVKTGKAQCEQMFSAVHPTTDIAKILRHVRLVPEAEIPFAAIYSEFAGACASAMIYSGSPAALRPSNNLVMCSERRRTVRLFTSEMHNVGFICSELTIIRWVLITPLGDPVDPDVKRTLPTVCGPIAANAASNG